MPIRFRRTTPQAARENSAVVTRSAPVATTDVPHARDHNSPPTDDALAEPSDSLPRTTARRFAGLVATAAGLAGIGLLTTKPKTAEATYYPGAGPGGADLIDGHLHIGGQTTMMGGLGIGTTTPSAHITINSTGNMNMYFQVSGANRSGFFYQHTAFPFGLGIYEFTASGWPRIFIASTTGLVGVATHNPVQQLDVAGNIQASNALMVNGVVAVDSTATAKKSYYAP